MPEVKAEESGAASATDGCGVPLGMVEATTANSGGHQLHAEAAGDVGGRVAWLVGGFVEEL